MIAEVTAALLEDLDHTVIIANSAAEALEHLAERGDAINLLLTDHAMPGMTGIQLAAKAREQRPDLPVLLASGYAEIPSGEGLDLFRLAKPYRREDLEAGVVSVMAGNRQGSSNAVLGSGSAGAPSSRRGGLKLAGGSDVAFSGSFWLAGIMPP